MSQETLKWLRLLTPGVIALVAAMPIIFALAPTESLRPYADIIPTAVQLVAVIAIGMVYEQYELRQLVTRTAHKEITTHIGDRLQKLAGVRVDNPGRLTQLFYEFVDNDESLTKKAYRVRLNGYIWTTFADFIVIGALAFVSYVLSYPVLRSPIVAWSAVFAFVAFMLVEFSLYPRTVQKHIRLSADQLDFIEHKYSAEIRDKLRSWTVSNGTSATE